MALARWTGVVQDAGGNAIAGASIEVRREDTNALVPLFSDREGLEGLGNPFTAEEATFWFHAAGGSYRVTASLGGLHREWRYVAIGTAAEMDLGTLASGIAILPNLGALLGFAPEAAPDGVMVAGNEVEGDLGGYVHLVRVDDEPDHPGKAVDAAGNWYELDRGQDINPFFFERASHGGDHSLAFADAVDTLIEFGGGTIRYPHRGAVIDWNTAVSKTLPNRMRAVVDFGTNKIQLGDALFLGGEYELTNFLTLQGGASVDISSSVSAVYTNYIKLSVDVNTLGLRVGDRIFVSDSVNTWAGGDGRPCHFATVDYVDDTNDIINFYPGISIPVTISNGTTGQISATGLVFTIYPEDADITVRGGNIYGARHPQGENPGTAGQSAGGASPFGLLLQRGRGVVDGTNFYDLCTSVRFKEGSFRYLNSENQGSYNGYGVKADTRCQTVVDNCVLTGSRHAIGNAGSHPDGSVMLVTNSVIGGARQAHNYNFYPADEYGALDAHPSNISLEAHNCRIIGGFTHANGVMKIVGGSIVTRQTEGVGLVTGQGTDNCELQIIDVNIEVHPRTPTFDDVGYAGTFGSGASLFRAGTFEGTGSNARFVWKGGTVSFPRGTSWNNPTDFAVNLAHFIWTHFEVNGVKFLAEGTNIRRVLFNGRGDGGGLMDVRECLFDGCAPAFLNEAALDDWKALHIERNRVINTDGVFAVTAVDINGDTDATGTLRDIVIRDNYIESVGTTALINMSSSPRRSVTVEGNICTFTGASGTLTRGIRTHRNQNATGQHTRFLASVRGNKIMSLGAGMTGANTITTGIEILGLAAVSSLNAGYYHVGDNMVETAGTKITTTGTAVTAV